MTILPLRAVLHSCSKTDKEGGPHKIICKLAMRLFLLLLVFLLNQQRFSYACLLAAQSGFEHACLLLEFFNTTREFSHIAQPLLLPVHDFPQRTQFFFQLQQTPGYRFIPGNAKIIIGCCCGIVIRR